MKKSFRIRHQILEELFKSASTEKNPQIPKNRLSNVEISKRTGISIHDVDIFHELLHEEGEINCCFDSKALHEMLITSKGRQSYIDKKFIKQGRKEFWDNIYDPMKIILPIISIVIAAVAIYLNSSNSSKMQEIERRIKQIEEKAQINDKH